MEVMETAAGGGRDEVERLAQEFVERRHRGERPTIEEYAAAQPALAEEIRSLFAALLLVEDLGDELGDPASLSSRQGGVEPGPAAGLQQVGEFVILREIGRGGMGVVYEAEQASLGRRVALKVLPFHSLLDSKRLERFQQEARAAARLSHPNIVPVYGVGEHLGMHYYVMQLIPGQGLNHVIEEVRRQREAGESGAADRTPAVGDLSEAREAEEPDGGSNAPPSSSSSSSFAAGLDSGAGRSGRERYFLNAARLARDAALALDYAHGQAILHRDVKPSNLLLDASGRVWLADFGLAKAEGSDDLTKSNDFVGTVPYMAPERFKGWSDPRSDVYGLGITLYELLTLRPAFAERDRAQLIRKAASENPPAPRRLDRAIPRDLETVVLKSIAKEPAQRYGSARAMAEDLDRFLLGLPVEARRSHALARLARWCGRNPLPASLTALVAILLIAGTAVSSSYAVRLSREHAAGQEKLRAAYLAEARALGASARPGRRLDALEALRRAAEIRPGADLVDAAIASFALVDLRPVKTWDKTKREGFEPSPDGSTVAFALRGGEIVLRSAADDRELFRLPGSGYDTPYCWVKFSPDGRRLCARYLRGQESEWRIWELDRRAASLRLNDVYTGDALAFSPDNRRVAFITKERSLRLYDLATGRVLEELGCGLEIDRVAIHPGCRLIAVVAGPQRRKVYVYDRDVGAVIRSLSTSDQTVIERVAWHPDGKTLAAASPDHLVYVWNAETGELTRTLQGHWAEAVGGTFDPDGYLLVSRGWEPAVRFWEPASDRPVLSISHNEGRFASDRRSFWTVDDYFVDRWELESAMPAFTVFGHDGKTTKHPLAITLAPGGRLAATGGEDGVRLWDLARRREVGHVGSGRVASVFFDAVGKALYASGQEGIFRWPVRPIHAGSDRVAVGPAQPLSHLDGWRRAVLSDAGSKIAAVHGNQHAHIIDLTDLERDVQLQGPPPSWRIALSPDGVWAAVGIFRYADAKEVWVWDLRDVKPGGEARPARKLPARWAQVEFHPGGKHLATCTPWDCTLWRIADWEPAWRVERERGLTYPAEIAFDRSGKIAAFGYSDSKIWLVEAETGRKLHELEASEPIRLTGLAIEGGTLAASTDGRRFHVWDLNGLGRELAALRLHWEVPAEGKSLADLAPLRVAVAEKSIDILLDETSDLAPQELFRPTTVSAFALELVSFGEIDRALATPAYVVPEGEKWKYFQGRAEPSGGMEWTALDFDDGRWETGGSPLTGWVLPEGSQGTHLATQPGSYTTLYLRRVFEVADAAAVSRLILAVELEDGFVAYLNGEEVGRANAGKPAERLSFQALAPGSDRPRQAEVLEVSPALLRSGKNVLAVQALSHGLDSRVHILPVLALVPVPEAERDSRRAGNLAAGEGGAPDAALLVYRDGRILQRAGRLPEALVELERAGGLDRGAAEPLLRRLACHRALGEPGRAEMLAREAIEAGEVLDDVWLWRAWLHTTLVDLRRSPAAALASLPADPRAAPARAASDHRWLLDELTRGAAIRINCGGGDVESKDGKRWSRDRFVLGGFSHDRRPGAERGAEPPGEGDRALISTERWFGGTGPLRRAYSIPLPSGRYRVLLHLDERTISGGGRRLYDVLLEGRSVRESGETLRALPGTPERRSFEVTVVDGALDIDFVAHQNNPGISAIEGEKLAE
jgi:serine/threonine protein kinase/WD40 repeat protein